MTGITLKFYYKVIQIFSKRRLPWRFTNFINISSNICHFYYKCFVSLLSTEAKSSNKNIVFCCGFHGFSGGPIAISAIANLLANRHQVSFVSFPTSNYNKLLNSSVKLITSVDYDADIFIADEGCDHNILSLMSSAEGKLIITCHCLKDRQVGPNSDFIYKSFSYADEIHFVGSVQQVAFNLDKKPRIIANSCYQVDKTEYGNTAGTVGRLTDPDKNAQLSVAIAEKSELLPFHLWGANQEDFIQKNVVVHSWESDKQKIYNSIDVLVFLSKYETFGLVVIEAMSAGIPCLLSNIPAFQQYRNCPGIELVDLNDTTGADKQLKHLMGNKEALREEMIMHWSANYSNDAVAKQWFEFIEEMVNSH